MLSNKSVLDIQEMHGQNGTGSKNFLRNCAMGLCLDAVFCLQCFLYLDTVYVICKHRNRYI